MVFLSGSVWGGSYRFTVEGERTLLNGEEILVKGLRCSNALMSEAATAQLIRNLDEFASYGVNTVSVFFMGSRFGDIKGYRADASLDPVYAGRMGRIIEAADRRGMVVLVGCLYWSNSRCKWEHWTQKHANAAVANTVRWLKQNDYRNVFVDVDNEGMALRAKGFDNRKMVIAGKKVDPDCMLATNFRGMPPAEADLAIHHSKKVEGKPYIDSEATPGNAPGGYWGRYSKKPDYYNYINIGVYNDQMKARQKTDAKQHLDNGMGYILASTWLQCVPPFGPNNRPGGDGSTDDPGIRWWLEWLRDEYGSYSPPALEEQDSATVRVGRWERFEATITNYREYRDPFRDVRLDVTYTRPNGSKVEFMGFFDGAHRWKIRFMPDMVGLWRYEAKFSDGEEGANGLFRCVGSDIGGMVRAYANNERWFGHAAGGPLMVRSFHVGDRFFAENFEPEDRRRFLDWAGSRGYNMLSIGSHYLNRRAGGRGKGWHTPNLWDGRPVPDQYKNMEAILDDLAKRGIMVFPFAGFFGRDSNYPRSAADQKLYIEYTLARIGCYWSILLNIAGPEPKLRGRSFLGDDLDRLGKLIAETDVFDHPLTVHNRTGDDEYAKNSYISFVTLQGPKTTDRQKLSRGLLRNLYPGKPLYAQETLWTGNKNHPQYSMVDLRKNAWVLMMSSASLNFADNDGNSSSGFSGSMDLSQANDRAHAIIGRVWDYFQTLPYYEMEPHQELVDNGFCLARPGSKYLVYLPSRGTVDVAISGGRFDVWWVNGRDVTQRQDAGETNDGKNLAPPKGGDDWLLILTRNYSG